MKEHELENAFFFLDRSISLRVFAHSYNIMYTIVWSSFAFAKHENTGAWLNYFDVIQLIVIPVIIYLIQCRLSSSSSDSPQNRNARPTYEPNNNESRKSSYTIICWTFSVTLLW